MGWVGRRHLLFGHGRLASPHIQYYKTGHQSQFSSSDAITLATEMPLDKRRKEEGGGGRDRGQSTDFGGCTKIKREEDARKVSLLGGGGGGARGAGEFKTPVGRTNNTSSSSSSGRKGASALLSSLPPFCSLLVRSPRHTKLERFSIFHIYGRFFSLYTGVLDPSSRRGGAGARALSLHLGQQGQGEA